MPRGLNAASKSSDAEDAEMGELVTSSAAEDAGRRENAK